MNLEMLDASDARVETIWRELEAANPPKYFLSWAWVENWLACIPRVNAPGLGVLSERGNVVAACFLGRHRHVRYLMVPSRTMHLNATGVPHIDELCIEHNDLLRAPGSDLSIATLVSLIPKVWDEFVLPGLNHDAVAALTSECARLRYRLRIDREVSAPFVDLARVRTSSDGYLGLLSSQTRAQIRRAQRGAGELSVEVAADPHEALAIYIELVALHRTYWKSRGEQGAFADPWFDHFHRRLIMQRFRRGEIQLVRVRDASGTTLGCLYNFVSAGRVLFYQSGFAPQSDARIKPGYLCHTAAIEHCAAAGHAVYDFLAGDARYKRCLSTGEVRLAWVRIQLPLARFAIEDRLRTLKQSFSTVTAPRVTSV